jgi:hypothetical protein
MQMICCAAGKDGFSPILTAPKSWGPQVDQHAISALLFFECMLRDAIAQRRGG